MQAKNVEFSINQCDDDGNSFDDCILIHIDDNTIIRFDNISQLISFRNSLNVCIDVIERNGGSNHES